MAWRMGKCTGVLTLAVAALAGTQSASAAAYLQLDVNSASVQAHDSSGAPVFNGTTHTGDLTFVADATCILNDTLFDGVTQNPVHVPVDVTGQVFLAGGVVQAGSTVTFHFLNSPSPDNTYTFPLLAGGGAMDTQAGGFFKLIADMGPAVFSNANPVGGVNITPWIVANDGAFTLDHFAPVSGFSNDVNLETLVPEPASLGAVGLAAVSILARRRRLT